MKRIYFNAEKKEYTFHEKEGEKLNKNVVPPKFSPQDKYGKYRRVAKSAELQAKFLQK